MALLVGLILTNFLLLSHGSPLSPRYSEETPLTWSLDENEFYQPSKNASEYRLPGTTVPLEYRITFIVDPNQTTFDGNVTIHVKAVQATKEIVLHASSLITMIGHSVSESGIGELESVMTRPADDREFLVLTLTDDLVENTVYRLNFVYTARFGSLNGLYRSTYRDENNTLVYLAATHFQATSARKAFPCYDEPAFKSVFNVNIYAPPNYNPISNMDVIEPYLPTIPNNRLTSFRASPLMPAYLVAFIISDFEYASNTESGQIIYPREFRIYGKPGTRENMDYGLDFGQRSVQFLQGYTDVSYRLPKLDNAAIPDFGPGAMENWGLITYREQALLKFKGITTQTESQISTTMTHELAHFWFGDEVSPIWWDYLWLSEGFATYFQWFATDNVYNGEWRLMEQFTANDLQATMNTDASPSINPMTNTVGSPTEVSRNFNSIAYQKSGAVIRMFRHAIGEARFRLALSNYLKGLPTGVAEPNMLFSALQNVVQDTELLPQGVTMNDIFGSWSNQAGFPIVYANRVTRDEIKVTQERFFTNSSLTSNSSWWVPLTFTSSYNPTFDRTIVEEWLSPNTEMTIPIQEDQEWYIFNLQQSGYYRVMYDEENWIALARVLRTNHSLFHPLNRAQLIDDASTFAITGRLTYNRTFDMLAQLKSDDDWIPWISANRAINNLNPLMPASEVYSVYQFFLLTISKKFYESVSYNVGENDGYVTKRKRILALNIGCKAGSFDCSLQATSILQEYLNDPEKTIHPDLKSIVYCHGVKTDNSMWNATYTKYGMETLESEKQVMLLGLGCSDNESTIERYLGMTIRNDTNIRPQDRVLAVQSVYLGKANGVGQTISFLIQNFLNYRLSLPNPSSITTIIQNLGSLIVKDSDIELFRTFTDAFDSQFTTAERTALNNAWRSIETNQKWIATNMETIDAWLIESLFVSSSSTIQGSILLTLFVIIYTAIKM